MMTISAANAPAVSIWYRDVKMCQPMPAVPPAMPNTISALITARQARAQPVYEEIEGWSESTEGARSWADLPAQAVKYVRHIEELIGAPVALLSTSPEREDTILVTDPFQD